MHGYKYCIYFQFCNVLTICTVSSLIYGTGYNFRCCFVSLFSAIQCNLRDAETKFIIMYQDRSQCIQTTSAEQEELNI